MAGPRHRMPLGRGSGRCCSRNTSAGVCHAKASLQPRRRATSAIIHHAALSGFENDGTRIFDISALAQLGEAGYDGLEPRRWPQPAGGGRGGRLLADREFATTSGRARLVPTAWRGWQRRRAMPIRSIGARPAGRRAERPLARDAALGIGDGAVLLAPCGSRQNDIRVARRVGRPAIDDDDEPTGLERAGRQTWQPSTVDP
jgi:hypothetical protein